MRRWAALAGRSRGGETDEEGTGGRGDRPPTLEEFIEDNYRLFTVISVFGTLAVYLTQFQRSSTAATKGGVGAVLVLFMLTAVVALRNSYRATERARAHGAYALLFGYAVFMYAFVTLVVSVVLVIVGRYAQGAESVLGSSVVYALVFVYVPFIARADAFAEFDGGPLTARAVRRTPHLAALLLASWYAVQWYRDALPTVEFGSAAYSIGIVLSLVGHHFLITVAVFAALRALDRIGRVVAGALGAGGAR
ncbi:MULTISPECIES: hypothetical protein [Halorussus]|uniref:hypothetical protein n=1 Tax=Halorussus TaxID=1070314 RepID=UPI0020A1832D|nr:hypothetical protein [Halorussus vallis]USZ77972.1 hypothetical protein NGM07_22625 [Halorussus vallis]USZ78004.1 hypothetical protein NGM07_20290 [Halorussus vallis]